MVAAADLRPTGPKGLDGLEERTNAARRELGRAASGVRRYLYLVPTVYLVLATAWIVFSDYAVTLIGDHELETQLQSYKGLFYVLVTTVLLAVLVRAQFKRLVTLAERLAQSNREREELLREVHHRVKNNLQVMESLLGLQARTLDDPACVEAFARATMRFRSISLVHENLYQAEDMSAVDFEGYLGRLASDVRGRFQTPSATVTVAHCPISLPLTKAVPCGMIAGELIDNSLRHAFAPDRPGRVEVGLDRKDGQLVLSVSDNGRWRGEEEGDPGFGFSLVELLARQLGGSFERHADVTGSRALVRFPE